jgi:hypothetical protein
MDCAARAANDDDVTAVYERIDRLPKLPRPGGGPLPAYNLLTPLIACLEPRARAPIINAREEVRAKLRNLRLANSTLGEQCRGLVGLLGQAGLRDVFALDAATPSELGNIRPARPLRRRRARFSRRTLRRHVDDDIEFVSKAKKIIQRRRHHTMTNSLRAICGELKLEEGAGAPCLFDALLHAYEDTERSLLIEVKTQTDAPFVRMAVGQLLDYRRMLGGNAAIDLAVLLPRKPGKAILDFLGYVGVKALWFTEDMRRISGDVDLPRRAPA